MKELAIFNLDNITPEQEKDFRVRKVARAVVFDSENKIAVIYSKKYNFHALPGGGIEDGESSEQAVIRECKEEIGCDVSIEKEIGYVFEYSKIKKMKYESFCYIARVVGEKGKPSLTEEEIDIGISTKWVFFDDAIELIKVSDKPFSHLAFLGEVKSLLVK